MITAACYAPPNDTKEHVISCGNPYQIGICFLAKNSTNLQLFSQQQEDQTTQEPTGLVLISSLLSPKSDSYNHQLVPEVKVSLLGNQRSTLVKEMRYLPRNQILWLMCGHSSSVELSC